MIFMQGMMQETMGIPGLPGAMPGQPVVQSDEALASIPGAETIKKIFDQYGLDSSVLVTAGIMLTVFNSFTGLFQFLMSLIYQIIGLFSDYCLSKASIKSADEAYDYIMEYLIQNKVSTDSRSFVVDTNQSVVAKKYKTMFYEGVSFDDVNKPEFDYVQTDNFGPKLKFIPSTSNRRFFFYRRTLFIVKREIDQLAGASQNSNQRPEDESIDIWTVGRNPAVLRSFLSDCRLKYLKEQEHKTVIHTTDNYDMNWSAAQTRPLRSLDSVIMTAKDKTKIVNDIKDYLSPKTKAWYAEQGIPYRRGYLLYGLPGTGKTSLTMALAGELNVKLFILSLAAQNLHDNYLQDLFMTLPPKAIVLLEDVDSANVDRDYGYGTPEDDIDSDDEVEVDKVLRNNNRGRRRPSNISLSGLLNAIDGIGAQEGRILIMTTNHRESLDHALIRPGRVDVEIEFGKANREVLEQIFIQLFIHRSKIAGVGTGPNPDAIDGTGAHNLAQEKSPFDLLDEEAYKQDVESSARKFAETVPEDMFTPAEIQNYLLPRKRSYRRALDELPQWLDDQLAEFRRAEQKAQKMRQRAINKRKRWMKDRKQMRISELEFLEEEPEQSKTTKEDATVEGAAGDASDDKEKTTTTTTTSDDSVAESISADGEKKDTDASSPSEKKKEEDKNKTSPELEIIDKAIEAVKNMAANDDKDKNNSNGDTDSVGSGRKSVDGDWSDVESSRPASAE